MTTFERVKKLADSQKISIVELEEKLGFGKNSLYRWKTSAPASDKLQKVADYFNVSTDYLLGRTTKNVNNELEDDRFGSNLINHFRLNTANLDTEDIEELEEELKEYTEFLIERAKKKKRN
ncbi:helix-turn-helix transcriptional regulator [Enterococcus sp. BWR-S5]|uniref:helix-turn-helix domain-containing protein n=1 Tax=Enterococcus sp. BWR-S5 TaxID=2787714 RepID=UPI001924A8ED|nr:helix-turn-helix transcriptional regulator [Enterococcus sp. BWR-S5]